jgi:CMP-N-acetylneuraminic acid synthetase
MFRGRKVLGVIPARGGSKRLPNKNIRYLCDKPLIAWTIKAALDASILDKVVVSTESAEIARVATEWGVNDVIERSEVLSDDCASTNDVLIEVLDILNGRGEAFGYIVLLQPTSPLRTATHIQDAFDLMEAKNSIGAISMCRTEHPTEWMGKISDDGFLDTFILQTDLEKKSQDFSQSFQINGAIYIALVDRFLDERTIFLKTGMIAYVMDRTSSVDIDDEYDMLLAAWLLNQRVESVVLLDQ